MDTKKTWWASKSIWVQLLGLIGMILIGAGLIGEPQWAIYEGIITQVLGVVMRLVTKESIT